MSVGYQLWGMLPGPPQPDDPDLPAYAEQGRDLHLCEECWTLVPGDALDRHTQAVH